jgi:predicted transcriptional regulator
MTRTELSQAANIHHSKLVDQLLLLKQKQCVELNVDEGKVVVTLTEKGREFGIKLQELG